MKLASGSLPPTQRPRSPLRKTCPIRFGSEAWLHVDGTRLRFIFTTEVKRDCDRLVRCSVCSDADLVSDSEVNRELNTKARLYTNPCFDFAHKLSVCG